MTLKMPLRPPLVKKPLPMADELLERLRNPPGFAVLHTDAMQAIERIEKAEADRDMFKADWHAMIKQIEELEKQLEIYKDLYATEAVKNV